MIPLSDLNMIGIFQTSILRRFVAISLILHFSFGSVSWAQTSSNDPFLIKRDDSTAKSGSVYLTSHKKNEVLFKISIWGNVQYPGIHYLPLGTRFLEALSIAGGPLDTADMEKITLSTAGTQGVKIENLSIYKALETESSNPVLKTDDIIFVKEDRTIKNTSFYMQVGTFVLSIAAFGLLVNQHNR